MMGRAALLLGAALSALQPVREGPRIPLLLSGAPGPDARRGIELGVAETAHTVRLLGGDVTLLRSPAAPGAVLAGVIVADGGTGSPEGVPTIHLGPLSPGAGGCDFSVTDATEGTVLWHPTLNRFGASELNERFVARFRTGMSGRAYAGWVAVKALVESALRANGPDDRCASLGRLRFDGHKGRPLSFDPRTRVLRQPLYTVRDGQAVGKQP